MTEHIYKPRKLYYRLNDFQTGRPTVVFVHGLSGSSSAWLPYEKQLESSCNILSIDLRGHGKSSKPREYSAYAIGNFADDLNELLQDCKISNFVLVGHSFGCLVNLAFLKKHQDKVSKVVFLAPHYRVGKMLSAKIINPVVAAGIALAKLLPFSEKPGGHVDYSRFPNSGDWNIPRMIADVGNTTLRVYLYATRQSYEFDAEKLLEKIAIPTLIIHGGKDSIFPVKYGLEMAGKIPGAKLVVLKDADHILVLNKVPELTAEIKKFIFDGAL